MSDTVVVSPAHNVPDENKLGLTPRCTLETAKRFHGQPGETPSDEAIKRIRKSMALPPEE
jgi:hypothetical protein